MALIAVTYVYGGSPEALAEHRPVHREFLRSLLASGDLLAAGPFDDDEHAGALLLVEAPSTQEALAILDPDPLLVESVITERTARPWRITVGELS